MRGITIDYERTGYSEGEIVELSGKRMVLRIDRKEYPYRVFHGSSISEKKKGVSPAVLWLSGDGQKEKCPSLSRKGY
ncbi:MAG: hypothetical protein ACLUUO_08515 [Sellimonas intestinalis]